MVDDCPNPSEPPENGTTRRDAETPEDEGQSPPDELGGSVEERLERYFVIASTRCSSCGDIHGTVTVDGDAYTAADFEIDSRAEWSDRLDEEEVWMQENRTAVEAVLCNLEDDWPRSVAALRNHVL